MSALAETSSALTKASPSPEDRALFALAATRYARRYTLSHPAASESRPRSSLSRHGAADLCPTNHEHEAVVRELRPNPSVNLTRYGRRRKPGRASLRQVCPSGLTPPAVAGRLPLR